MKTLLLYAWANLVPNALLLLTGYMIYAGKPNWGWVLLIVALSYSTLETKQSNTKEP